MDKKPSFKPYNQGQITFLPPSLEELIPEDHIVRIVDSAIENIDTKPLYEKYEGGGASSYNPVMMPIHRKYFHAGALPRTAEKTLCLCGLAE